MRELSGLEKLIKNKEGLTKEKVCSNTSLTYPTFLKKVKDPETFTVYDLRKIAECFNWSASKLIKEGQI